MSTKDKVFGMDQAIQDKIRAKFDPAKAQEAALWIQALSDEQVDPNDLCGTLKTGVALCKAINKIKPGSVRNVSKSKMAFPQRENIVAYLNACKKLGQKDTDCFVTQDLYEGDNLTLVVDQIFSLAAVARTVPGFDGPFIGSVKYSSENKRVFSDEVIKAGKAAIPLQTAGSVAVEKEKGTDKIVRYGKVGQAMGNASSAVPMLAEASNATDKGSNLDAIIRQPMSKAAAGAAAGGGGGGGDKPKFCSGCGAKFGANPPKFCAECGQRS